MIQTNCCRCVEDINLFVTGRHSFQHFKNLADAGYIMSPNQIEDCICLPLDKFRDPACVVACRDQTLRVVIVSFLFRTVDLWFYPFSCKFKNGKFVSQFDIFGTPSCITLAQNDGGPDGDNIVYGTDNGQLGLVQLDERCLFLHTCNESMK